MSIDSKLKILITDPHIKGGGQITYVCRLAQGLKQLGHDVYVGCGENSVFVENCDNLSIYSA